MPIHSTHAARVNRTISNGTYNWEQTPGKSTQQLTLYMVGDGGEGAELFRLISSAAATHDAKVAITLDGNKATFVAPADLVKALNDKVSSAGVAQVNF